LLSALFDFFFNGRYENEIEVSDCITIV
jgi:hypothetical protein